MKFQRSAISQYPKIFNVTLISASNDALISPVYGSSRILITNKVTTGQFLRLRSITLNLPLTDTEIEDVLNKLSAAIQVPPISSEDQSIMKGSIETILDFKSSLPQGQQSLTTKARETLLDIFDTLSTSSREDTQGKSYWMKILEQVAYHLLNDFRCPTEISFTRKNFNLKAQRKNGSAINGLQFTNGKNLLRYPVNVFATDGLSSCDDVHFIELSNAHWFDKQEEILNGKVSDILFVFSAAVTNLAHTPFLVCLTFFRLMFFFHTP